MQSSSNEKSIATNRTYVLQVIYTDRVMNSTFLAHVSYAQK